MLFPHDRELGGLSLDLDKESHSEVLGGTPSTMSLREFGVLVWRALLN